MCVRCGEERPEERLVEKKEKREERLDKREERRGKKKMIWRSIFLVR